ncbi:PilZ domain-containing protein [Aurantiacibacter poecillastricola]|uniref:PilZ domain-containing protein n=1 Tax=Aurantiacibacter poecillastricola TaxID=3064385 RepID=UPI00273ECCF8|nr:PilZ domain-containing protein [Aurantiacibacter sp. 219JJ12-13]MDP5262460.1 PilZ domain-containing protein [Aurantiacibacter sp. 219JJ12-13]
MPTSSQKDRTEPRETAVLRASIVDSRGARQASISDLSSRGFSGVMDHPPARGDFIDIGFPTCRLAGQVRWVEGRKFGVRLSERVDPEVLKGFRRPQRKRARSDETVAPDEPKTLASTLVAYSVMGLTALSTAYLIVTYLV